MQPEQTNTLLSTVGNRENILQAGSLQAVSQRNSTNELVRRFTAFKVVFVLFTSHNYAEKHMVLGHIADEEKAQGG